MALRTALSLALLGLALWTQPAWAQPTCNPVNLKGILYSPYAEDPTQPCLSFASINRDLVILSRYTTSIRLSGIAQCPDATRQILSFCQARGMTVFLGLSVTQNTAANEAEINLLPSILLTYGNSGVMSGIAVGNQPLTSYNVQLDYLIWFIRRVRIMVHYQWTIPVTTVETATQWDNAQVPDTVAWRLSPEIDFVAVNINPYLEGVPANCSGPGMPTPCTDAATWTLARWRGLQTSLGMVVWVTGVGWPSQGERSSNLVPSGFPPSSPQFMAVPSVPNLNILLSRFSSLAQQQGVAYYFTEMFDAAWKRVWSPCTSCAHLSGCVNGFCTYDYYYGLFTSDRQPKAGVALSTGSCPPPPPLALPPPSPAPPPMLSPPSPPPPSPRTPAPPGTRSPPPSPMPPPPLPPPPPPFPPPPRPPAPKRSPPPPPTSPSPPSPPPPPPVLYPPPPPSIPQDPSWPDAPQPLSPPNAPQSPPRPDAPHYAPSSPPQNPPTVPSPPSPSPNPPGWVHPPCPPPNPNPPRPPFPPPSPPPRPPRPSPPPPRPTSPPAPPPSPPLPPQPPLAQCTMLAPCVSSRPQWYCYGTGNATGGCRDTFWGPFLPSDCSAQCSTAPLSPPPSPPLPPSPPAPPRPPPSPRPPTPPPSPPDCDPCIAHRPPPPPSQPPSPPSPSYSVCPTSPCPTDSIYFYCSGSGLARDGCQDVSLGPWSDAFCSAQCLTSPLTSTSKVLSVLGGAAQDAVVTTASGAASAQPKSAGTTVHVSFMCMGAALLLWLVLGV